MLKTWNGHIFIRILNFQNLFYCPNYDVSSSKWDFKWKIEISAFSPLKRMKFTFIVSIWESNDQFFKNKLKKLKSANYLPEIPKITLRSIPYSRMEFHVLGINEKNSIELNCFILYRFRQKNNAFNLDLNWQRCDIFE